MPRKPRATPAEPKVSAKQRAYAESFLVHGDKKRAAREAGFEAWETNYCTIHKARGTQHALMALAKDAREHLPITADYLMATMHEIVERCMQAKPIKDARGNPVLTEIELDDGTLQVAQIVSFDGRTAMAAITKMGEAIQMFRPPEKADDSAAERERAERDRNVLSELKRIADAVERKPGMQSAPVIGIEDGEKPRRVN